MDLLVEAALKRALAAPGCPICRMGEEVARRYLRFVLHESVNDPATRSRLASAWGFCRRHAWHFLRLEGMTMRDGMSTANLAEGLLEAAEETLRDRPAGAGPSPSLKRRARQKRERFLRALTPTGPCPACDLQTKQEGYSLMVLLRVLSEDTWRGRVAKSEGLCLPHLREALDQGEPEAPLRWLLEDFRRRVAELREQIEEYLRKHDYRFSGEPYGPERDAYVRATALLAGNWFDLPGPARESGGGWEEDGRSEAEGVTGGEGHG